MLKIGCFPHRLKCNKGPTVQPLKVDWGVCLQVYELRTAVSSAEEYISHQPHRAFLKCDGGAVWPNLDAPRAMPARPFSFSVRRRAWETLPQDAL